MKEVRSMYLRCVVIELSMLFYIYIYIYILLPIIKYVYKR